MINPKAILLLFATCFYCINSNGQGNLLIFPKRIVFEGTRDRVKTLTLHNSGRDTVNYRIAYQEMQMSPSGDLRRLTDTTPSFSAARYLRIYPRSVTLAPGESQVVKVQLYKTHSLGPGEYRSHLYFRAEPLQGKSKAATVQENTSDVSVSITPVYGISIANIIRIGESDTTLSIDKLQLHKKDNKSYLTMDIQRRGNYSSYGTVTVSHNPDSQTKRTVALVKGVGIYTPGHLRSFTIELQESDYSKGTLEVTYHEENTEIVLAKSSVSLQ